MKFFCTAVVFPSATAIAMSYTDSVEDRLANAMKISGPRCLPGKPIRPPDDEVHLWQVDLASAAGAEEEWRSILSADEIARAGRFRFAQDRKFYTATRAILRRILGGYTAADPRELVFRYSEREKPSLSGDEAGKIEFNVSHSGQVALLAFARERSLGVDVEQIRGGRDHEAIARRFFSQHEQEQLSALPPSERAAAFFRCWTRKEAYIKATGDGLALPLHQFDVSLAAGEENALLATRPDAGEAAKWTLREVPAAEGYAAALCVRGRGWQLRSERF
jgi:4'-phosphopantetheinyl transferase